jgi:hypothetical protein
MLGALLNRGGDDRDRREQRVEKIDLASFINQYLTDEKTQSRYSGSQLDELMYQ